MIIKIFDIEFDVSSQLDDFEEDLMVNFCPVGAHNLVYKHPPYFKYTAQVNHKTGFIRFNGIDLDSGHYANGYHKIGISNKPEYIIIPPLKEKTLRSFERRKNKSEETFVVGFIPLFVSE